MLRLSSLMGSMEVAWATGPKPVEVHRPMQVPAAPTYLRAKALNDGTVFLTWDAPDDDSVTGYLVGWRRHQPGERFSVTVETVVETQSTETAFSHTAGVHDVLHAYWVKAVNAAGASGRSNYDNATPFVGQFWEVGFHLPIVHLTFDDGPSPTITPQILDLLAEYGARATFFVNGTRAALHPELIARITSEGHSVGNHAWQHERLTELSREDFNSTLTRAQDLLGERGVPCMRPPYGDIDSRTSAWASSLGLRVVTWSLNSGDSAGAKADTMISRLTDNVSYFDVVLMHDTGQETVEAVRELLKRWAQLGFEFKPVCEPPATAAVPLNTVTTESPTVPVAEDDLGPGVPEAPQNLTPEGVAPLVAEFEDLPASHTGSDPFTVRLAFSEPIANGYIQVRDRSVEVTGGLVLTASRVERRKDLWEITILPRTTDHVTIVVAAATDCATWAHICTDAGKKLSYRLQLTVPGP